MSPIRPRTLAAVAVLTLALAAPGAHAQTVAARPARAAARPQKAADFSGVWEMNVAQSNFAEASAQAPTKATMTITQTAKTVKIVQAVTTSSGDMTTTSEYPLDGTASTQNAPDGLPTTTTARLDGPAMVLDSRMQRQGVEILRSSRWTLSPDRKVLTAVQQLQTPMAAMTLNIVFDRKP
jgi:hypothetical protein